MAQQLILTLSGQAAKVDVFYSSDYDEYTVHVAGSNDDADYVTDDRKDAISTAGYMATGDAIPVPR